VLVGLVCSGLGLGGCGKSDDGEGIALEDLAAAEADAHCASIEPCCQEEGRDFDPVECRQVAQEVIDGWLGVIDWSRFSYDAQAAADCLAAARGHTACEAKLVDFDVPACERIFPGKVPAGGQCRHEDECQQSSQCESDECGTDSGACETPTVSAMACAEAVESRKQDRTQIPSLSRISRATWQMRTVRGSSRAVRAKASASMRLIAGSGLAPMWRTSLAEIDKSRVGYDEQAAGDCIAAFRRRSSRAAGAGEEREDAPLAQFAIGRRGLHGYSRRCQSEECDYETETCGVVAREQTVSARECTTYFGD
jgi:hypothetical protein